MSVIKFVVPLALTVIVAGSHAVAQNIYVDMATGIAQQGLAQADELVALAPNQLRKSLDIAIEGHDFESEEFCLGNIQAVVNLGSVLSNMMPFSEVWTLEDERGPVGKLRVMLNGQRVHTEVFCDGATLKALELPWGVGDAVPHRFTNNSLSALLGVGLNFKLQGLLDDDVEPSPEMLSSMGAAANTSDGLVRAAQAQLVTTSARPKTRPNRPVPATPSETTSASDDATVAAALAAALAATAPDLPAGPPMTGSETEGFRLAIGECWDADTGGQSANVKVTVAFSLDRSGKVAGDVRQVTAEGGDQAAVDTAFRAARTAILRCGASGYDLPADKYDQWKEVEMTFDPSAIRLR